MDVLALANRLPTIIFGSKSDDDFSDRLNYRYTVALLVIFSVIITTRQFGSEVIKCWVPAHFTSNYEQYASQICWISNTYYTAPNEHIPRDEVDRRKNEIKYYQWVSFILLFQALAFYCPRILWRTLSVRSGIDICDLVEAANNYKSAENYEKRESYMNYLVSNIDQYVDDIRRYEDKRPNSILLRIIGCLCPCTGKYLGNYIIILYFVVKIIYILNTIFQSFILGAILGKSFYYYGIEFVQQLFYGQGWIIDSKYFPKVTLCDFNIREIGHPNKSHRYTIQCVLPINLFNQQIFIFLWFWYLIVICWNIGGLILWSYRSFPIRSDNWIKRRVYLFNEILKKNEEKRGHSSKKFQNFVRRYLEPDGFFILRIICNNSSDFVASDLIKGLWIKHYEEYKDKGIFDDEPQNEQDGIDLELVPTDRPFPYDENQNLRNRYRRSQTQQFKPTNGDYYGIDLQTQYQPKQQQVRNNKLLITEQIGQQQQQVQLQDDESSSLINDQQNNDEVLYSVRKRDNNGIDV